MYGSESNSFSFMGVSNSETFLCEKDRNALDLNFLARPTFELEEDDDSDKREDEQEREEEEEEDNCRILESSSLQLKLPNSLGEFKVEEDEDGLKTPTSSDQKIPPVLLLQCPPAPRKPKSRTPLITKRKLAAQRRIILHDLSNEIEALFPPLLLADLGNKMKKVRPNDANRTYVS